MKREATISPDGLYRFHLLRSVEPACSCSRCAETTPLRFGYVLFCLNNPSKADAKIDDPTERRGWGFTHRMGYGSFVFVNTNPTRSTQTPKEPPPEHVLERNDLFLAAYAKQAAVIVAAWGTKALPELAQRAEKILRAVGPIKILELTNKGIPKHPLYLSNKQTPIFW